MTRTLVLVRHGRTSWNLEGRIQGQADVGLDGAGRQQAAALAAGLRPLRPSRLWSSDLVRARHTADAIGQECDQAVVADPRLREYAVGAREGLTFEEFARRFPQEYAAWCAGAAGPLVPGEETAAAVAARTSTALRELLDGLAPGETGVAVMHGACVKTAVGALIGWPGAPTGLTGMDNGCVALLVEHGRGLRLAAYNVPAHGLTTLAAPTDFASRAAAR